MLNNYVGYNMTKLRIMYGIVFLLGTSSLVAAEPQVSVTIYNDDLALVREVRSIQLDEGVQEYKFVDVASRIDPTSVHFKSLTDPNSIVLLEQNYEYDLVGTERLLQKYIDQELTATIEEGGTVTGTLLSSTGGDIIVQLENGQIRALKSEAVQSVFFPSLPEGLITRPTLVWMLDSQKAGQHESEISYLTSGIQWHAEYVAVVNETDTQLDLGGWVSIENNSGTAYENSKIKLVAGDVHRVRQPQPRPMRNQVYAMSAAKETAQFEEREFFEYHLYTLQRPATIKNRQIKQLSLFSPQTAEVEKIYSYDGEYHGKKVNVRLEFKNSKENGLGMPLPRGKVRVYKRDSDDSQEFIGEDAIDHTPKDETLRLTMGSAFDIVGERTVKDVQQINKRSRQQTVEITLRNHKEQQVEVLVIEHLYGDWKFVGSTPPVHKKTADRVEFQVQVPADGENTFEYTVLFQY